jgi:hypothetical protein
VALLEQLGGAGAISGMVAANVDAPLMFGSIV